jgi:hypothetical protein
VEGRAQSLISGIIPNFALEYAIKKVKEEGGIGNDGALNLLVDADDVNMLRKRKATGPEVILSKLSYRQNSE